MPHLATFLKLVLYRSAQRLESAARMALSVQKMQIFGKDFKELFQVGAASKQPLIGLKSLRMVIFIWHLMHLMKEKS